MKRKIIRIDETRCNGCGACARACHEGAIEMVGGKAQLTRDDYCDGLGDCLPACPTGAISFEEREAAAYDEKAVMENKKRKTVVTGGCPGMRAALLRRSDDIPSIATAGEKDAPVSFLRQWPVQIQLVPVHAPYFNGADLLIAADCTAYACASFHEKFIRGRVALIGCPKLDDIDYAEKLTEILQNNFIRSIEIVRMEVPCCGGMEMAVRKALSACGKAIPCHTTILATDGHILT